VTGDNLYHSLRIDKSIFARKVETGDIYIITPGIDQSIFAGKV